MRKLNCRSIGEQRTAGKVFKSKTLYFVHLT